MYKLAVAFCGISPVKVSETYSDHIYVEMWFQVTCCFIISSSLLTVGPVFCVSDYLVHVAMQF